MKSLKPACFLLLATVVATMAAVDADEIGPQGVSPGAPDRPAEISAACPTFNWEAVPGVEYYELVVYRLAADEVDVSAADLSSATEVLYITVPGGATGWTPETAACFDPGERYAWFVRAVMDVETGKVSEWSEPRFFEVAAAPSAEELERAIEVIRRWEAASGDGSLRLPSAADAVSAPVAVAVPAAASDAVADSGAGTGAGGGAIHPESVITGTAAIRGEQPDFSGETYGVVGINASPDGAGIGAANVTGGPDLVLDGAVPAEFTEAGVDRPSASAQTFSVTNTGGGGMMLDVDGSGVLTTASAIDADTLDGIDGADFATDVEAAALVMTHAASADHDGRYYTETELGTSGTPDAVHWDNLGGVPAGFADGVDDDTTYAFGSGVVFDGTHLRVDPAFFSTKTTTLDGSAGTSGTSIAIGADGLGIVAFRTFQAPDYVILAAHCIDTPCTGAQATIVDSGAAVGEDISVAIGADGFPVIGYFLEHDGVLAHDLKVVHCGDARCGLASNRPVEFPVSPDGFGVSVAIGADSLPLVSFPGLVPPGLRVAHLPYGY